jgi:hypothetical protein
MPPHNNPAAITQQFETTQQDMSHDTEIPTGPTTSPVPDENEILAPIANEESIPISDTLISNNSSIEATRTCIRTKKKRDFLQPKFHGKVYNVRNKSTQHTSGKQRVFTKDKTKLIDPDLNGDWYLRHMPKSTLPPAFQQGPLNLNSDGTKINFKKSHAGPWRIHWEQANAEEIVWLLTSSTIRPIHFREIPMDQVVTYVNPYASKS